jgi:hypothetical protein
MSFNRVKDDRESGMLPVKLLSARKLSKVKTIMSCCIKGYPELINEIKETNMLSHVKGKHTRFAW